MSRKLNHLITCGDCGCEFPPEKTKGGKRIITELCPPCQENLDDWEGREERLYQEAKARNPRAFED